uniref:Uncharacterized protein n=1 Tax=Physcomitrium patens TaxID=3218 RepID=A0A2K1JN50_PHYPA|nr:hypothetical protein PHYPA_017795 [Physcomitrium patens]
MPFILNSFGVDLNLHVAPILNLYWTSFEGRIYKNMVCYRAHSFDLSLFK